MVVCEDIRFSLVIQLLWYVERNEISKDREVGILDAGPGGAWSGRANYFLLGLGTLLRGHLEYPNYWGGAVFAPFAILVSLLVIVVAVVQGRRG